MPVLRRPYLPSHSAFISSSRPSHLVSLSYFAFIPFFVFFLSLLYFVFFFFFSSFCLLCLVSSRSKTIFSRLHLSRVRVLVSSQGWDTRLFICSASRRPPVPPPAISPILGGYVLCLLFNHSPLHPHICLIFDYVSFPGGPTVSAHSRLSCYTLGPTVASTVTQNNLARPRLRSRTHTTTTTTTTCGSPCLVFCSFWRMSSCRWELHNSSHSRGSCLFWYVSLLAHVNNNINSLAEFMNAPYTPSLLLLQESLAERGHA